MIERSMGIATLALLIVCGCTYRYEPTPERDFNGIAQEAGDSRVVRIFIIHGMGDHFPGYSQELVQRLAAHIGLSPTGAAVDRKILYRGQAVEAANLRLQRFNRAAKAQEYRLYELTWSPLTIPIKNKHLDFDRSPIYKWGRASLNRELKEGLIDRSLSDAVLYMGDFGEAMRWTVKEALCHMLNDAYSGAGSCNLRDVDVPGLESDQIVFISSSLGSRMLFDSMLELLGDAGSQAAMEQAIAKTNLLFMLANQVALLELSNVRDPIGLPARESGAALGPAPKDVGFGAFVRNWSMIQRERARLLQRPDAAARRPLRIVAFNDPNDLLSFGVVRDAGGSRQDVEIVNVVVSNVPEILGIVARPDTAHTGYGGNAGVRDLIVCGSKDLAPACK